jgi:hypothetical protein
MKNFILILSFIFLFILGDRIISKCLITLSKYSSLPYAKIYSGRAKSEILILGDSRAYHHLNDSDWASISRHKTFSLSITGSPMILQEVLLRDYVNLYGNPKTIVIELNALISPVDKVISLKYLGLLSDNFKQLMRIYYSKQLKICQTFNLFFLNTIDYLNLLHKIAIEYDQPKLVGEMTDNDLDNLINKEYSPYFQNTDYNVKSLERIIRDFGEDVKIILIITPFQKNFLENQFEKDDWFNKIESMIPKIIKIFDYSESVINNEYYFDDRHLNEKGVKKLLNNMNKDNFFQKLI